MKFLWFAVGFVGLWLLFAQSCMMFRVSDKKAKKQFAKKRVELNTFTITIDHRAIHYVRTGRDSFPLMVFIHGPPGSWNAFEDYLADSSLLQKYQMISVDRPGFGYSDFGMPLHLDRQSLLIGSLLRSVKNKRPLYLVGHSLGGPLTLKLAADFPDLVSGLVIISGSNDPAEEKKELWRPVLMYSPLKYFIPGAFRPSNEELWYLKKDLVSLEADIAKVSCPVYFIHGTNDTWVPPGNVTYTEKRLVKSPAVKEHLIPGGNHFIPWTKFTEIKSILIDSLN